MALERNASAMANRAIRTIKAELEYLADTSVISQEELCFILSRLPQQTASRDSPPSGQDNVPVSSMANLGVNDNDRFSGEHGGYHSASTLPAIQQSAYQPPKPAPPPYLATPAPPAVLTYAVALYRYEPADASDLALSPNERVAVIEYMNAEWWKGRSESTGQVGIFPRSYVTIEDRTSSTSNDKYGNLPMQVSQASSDQVPASAPNKHAQMGKRLGAKFGNAMVFGAGATAGADLVNSIF